MKRLLMQSRSGQKGFTLIELLIVVAILGIIAAVVIPNAAGFMATGTLNAANTEVANVKTAATGYMAEHNGTWPSSSADLGAFLEGGIDKLKATYTFTESEISAANPTIPNGWGDDIFWCVDTQTWKRVGTTCP